MMLDEDEMNEANNPLGPSVHGYYASPQFAAGHATNPATAYEEYCLNYALAASLQQGTDRSSSHSGSGRGQSKETMHDLSVKGQAEALSYKFWSTGRYAHKHGTRY